ncbi:MAG: GntR family transcriptional regulator [Peptococcaceae bacterium]|nr:GntR family transcriptional regulator [Peptococcaceae bacterium]
MSDQTAKVEEYLVRALLDGTYPPGGTLPGERELAGRLGVSRRNVQGVVQRMAKDGWFTTGERSKTRVNDFWSRGNLAVLNTLAANMDDGPGFVRDLLAVRRVIAPVYALEAVGRDPLRVVRCLARDLAAEDAEGLAGFDFELHLTLAGLAENRIYPMLLNSFDSLARRAGRLYFSHTACREASRRFYQRLLTAAAGGDARAAGRHTAAAMKESCRLWREITREEGSACGVGTAGETTRQHTL